MLRRHHTDYTYCATWWQLGGRIFRHHETAITR